MKIFKTILLIISKILLLIESFLAISISFLLVGMSGYKSLILFGYSIILYCVFCIVCCCGLVKGKVLLWLGMIFHIILSLGILTLNGYFSHKVHTEAAKAYTAGVIILVILWAIHTAVQNNLSSQKS